MAPTDGGDAASRPVGGETDAAGCVFISGAASMICATGAQARREM